MSRKSSRDISAQPKSRIDTSSVTEDGWGNNSSSSQFWSLLDSAYIKSRNRSPNPDQHRDWLKSSVQHLKRAGALFFGLVGIASVLFASWTLVAPAMMENVSATIGTALFLGTATLSRFGGGRGDEGNDDDASDDDDTTTEDNGPDWAGGTGVRYIRVSSLGQKDGHSLETQLDTLKGVANRHGIALPFSHIRDEGRTGTNFDREGIKEVLSLAKHGKIDTLLVVNLSRIGRKAPETIFFIYVLHEYYDVTVITPNGPRRLNTSKELMTTTLQALIDHLSSMNRTRQAVKSTIRRFKDRNWSSAYKDNIPFGYKPDGEWITPVAQVEDAVQDLFEYYLNSGSYTATGEYMSDEYGMSGFEGNPGKVKRHLTRGVYIGKPRMNVNSDKVAKNEVVVDDPTLKIVDEDIYEQVQTQTEQIARKNTTDGAKDIDDFVETFDMLSVFESSANLKLHCPECDSIMTKNGQAKIPSKKSVHRYRCTNADCKREYKFPNRLSFGAMEYLDEMITEEPDWLFES